MSAAQPVRGLQNFQGVLQILAFNWTFYAAGILLTGVTFALLRHFAIQPLIRMFLSAAMAITLFWMMSSLLVSHYVYDRSRLYRWHWLATLFDHPPQHWANIHAGLDQTSCALEQLFPDPGRKVFDIYNASTMTEPSIKRARRKESSVPRAQMADPAWLPLSDSECDAVFLIFTAHELRSSEDRRSLFLEVARSLKTDGRVVIIEHLRNFPNFLAYGPGAFHFHSRREWQTSWGIPGLEFEREISITPFVRCFSLAKTAA